MFAACRLPSMRHGVCHFLLRSALLISYYAGVSQALLERDVVRPGQTPITGLSGGAFTGTFL